MNYKSKIPELSSKSKMAISKIESFKDLRDNWDSYGALKPSLVAIDNAVNFIYLTENDGLDAYFVAPGRNGDVLVEYKITSKISSEIYFNSDGSNELLVLGDNYCIIEGTVEDRYKELINLYYENKK